MNVHKFAIEHHPLSPFLPERAKILLLGSFPPKQEKWSISFFYPNWINDMWRIWGHLFFQDKHHFEIPDKKQFDQEKIISFCTTQGIALYDTATSIRRLKDNAADQFLEVITTTDVSSLLNKLPICQAIVTTGQKATDILVDTYQCEAPAIGEKTTLYISNRMFHFWRMPSTSRAYPLAWEKKAAYYQKMLKIEQIMH